MWPFTPNTLYDRYGKLIKLTNHLTLRTIFLVLTLIHYNFLIAQRHTGYGRGMSNESFDFGSPTIKETITMLLVAIISFSISGILCKINENKEGKLSNVLTALTFLFGLAGIGAGLPLVFNYWYFLVIIVIGVALYGAFRDK